MSFHRCGTGGYSNIFAVRQRPYQIRSRRAPIFITLLSMVLFLTLFNDPAFSAGPCSCKDLKSIQENRDRAAESEEIWKEIFAWARGLYPSVAPPKSNDDLNQKFVQLKGAPRHEWANLINDGPVKEKKAIKKVAGLNEKGEPVIDKSFEENNCDDVIQAEHIHEKKHKDFYLGFPQIFDVVLEWRLLRLRAQSEVESYRAQKDFLDQKLTDMKLKCESLDKSAQALLKQREAERLRKNAAEIRIRLLGLGTTQSGNSQ